MPRTGRPPLGLGTYGEIRVYKMDSGRYKARTLYRDFDGVTRPVARNGASKNAAETALKNHLRDRVREAGAEAEITAGSTVEVLAEAWWAEFSKQDKSPGTFRLYRDRLDNQIIPALGKIRIRELTTGAANRHISTVSQNNGAGVAKATRTVLSNMCAFACQRDVMKTNPIREVAPVRPKAKKVPKALSVAELQQLRALFTYDPAAVRRDIPMLSSILLATGVRIGECLAFVEDALDPKEGSIEVRGTVIWLKGVGPIVKPAPKSAAGFRRLLLPKWAVNLLRSRFEESAVISKPVPVLNGEAWDSPLAFPTSTGRLRDITNVESYWREAVTTAGFDWVVPHTFRKTVATEMDRAGRTAREIADQLGHSQITLVHNTYLGRKARDTGAAAALEGLVA
ncbi:integrase family protein [Parafrankia sp. EAN1pec]|uniref:site-specific integrase n=1 Tax=Parafrankia sp. (strain EAN1pec) TaxID=298653 RepID=UPI0000544839|nr:integrase family protein [Frankia sp. EAN1pec]